MMETRAGIDPARAAFAALLAPCAARRLTVMDHRAMPRVMIWPSGTELHVLRIVSARGEITGPALVSATPGTFNRGGVHVTLGRMEEKGFLERHVENSEPQYKLTPVGVLLVRTAELYAKTRGASARERSESVSLED